MTLVATEEAFRAAARSLEESARHHKRSAAAHRRGAKEARRKLAELQERCDALGITLETHDEGQEATVNDGTPTRPLNART
jgi:alpha-D-ribose 1-methylphosphonate 5-triphosphate diphosphatase PhnM